MQIADMIYPWGENPRARKLRWGLHLAFWALVVALLWQINRAAELDRLLRSPWPTLHRYWLPLLAAALYPLGWLARGLWQALRESTTSGLYPELVSAWGQTRRDLTDAGVDLSATPAFLILGPASESLDTLLRGLGAQALPGRTGAFRTCVNSQAVFFVHDSRLSSGAAAESTPLHDLCRLVLHAKAPRHAFQGIVLVAVEREDDAWIRRALRAVRLASGLEIPVYFIAGGPSAIGQDGAVQLRFPPLPDLDPAEIALMYQHGVDWLCLERLPIELRARLRLESAARADNVRLFRQAANLASWRKSLVALIRDSTQTDHADPGMVAGCYPLPAGDAAELAKALQADLLRNQNAACWTAATVEREAAQKRMVRVGYGVILTAFLGAASYFAFGLALRL